MEALNLAMINQSNQPNITNNYELGQLKQLLRPPLPPVVFQNPISPETKNHAKFRNMKPLNGFGVYSSACGEQAISLGLNLPRNVIRTVATQLWKEEFPHIKNAYITETHDTNFVISKHKTQFLPKGHLHECSEKCDNSCH
ncbi:hypothetical protein RclHR1_00030007 [Rhizophagus clarus]|uniref:HMG box domain-containing protein n=1 Tax=Rhizophagus clarus TaxID=94130 RepID=A0A2Z6R5T6_9GLOM|nr:hypothetical protein RclHR1_00030007 [Rhizophagus clarus]GES92305.1 hypothetical protein GLOIN_2v821828 [Rhizophagus clarus]